MTRLAEMPPVAVIRASRGVLDYYYWRGIPVCRTWPQKYTRQRTAAVQASSAIFGDYLHALTLLDPSLIPAWTTMVADTDWTWRDMVVRAAYGHLNHP